MAHRPAVTTERAKPRLYLITPVVDDAEGLSRDLAAALGAADVAAVLLRLAPAGENEVTRRAKIVAPIAQDKGAALLLDGHPQLAARAGADGAHLTGIAAFSEAVKSLKPDRIAGAGGLQTRHDAMTAAERGADYVMLGEPDARGQRPSFEAIVERVAWWAEVFETPCVAFAATLDEIAPLVAAGADFVAVGDCIWNDARGPATAIAVAANRLALPEQVA
jgi:thiamine-phosphate pyrophosphorylase